MRDVTRLGHSIFVLKISSFSAFMWTRSFESSGVKCRIARVGSSSGISLRIKDGMVIVSEYKPLVDILDEIVSSLSRADSSTLRANHFISNNKNNFAIIDSSA